MPLYDWLCINCDQKVEEFALMHEVAKRCPTCQGMMKRLLSVGTRFNMPRKWGIDNKFGGDYDSMSEKDKVVFRRDYCSGDYFKEG